MRAHSLPVTCRMLALLAIAAASPAASLAGDGGGPNPNGISK